MIIKITANDIDSRLDIFLTKKLKNTSRSQVKKMVTTGQVLINDKPAKVHQWLKAEDKIKIVAPKPSVIAPKKPVKKITAPVIIFEDSNYLIIDKPVGLLVHPTMKNEPNTLVDWLIKKYPKISGVGGNVSRSGLVHRLDKDVSGTMVIAKNNKAFKDLKKQFQDRKVKKNYLAVVYGEVAKPQGEINLPIGRNKEGQFVAHPFKRGDKFQDKDKVAKTNYKVLEYVKDFSLLDVEILTGRTHQIRAHLTGVGHPILGDKVYGPKKKFFNLLRRKIKVQALPRILLHAKTLGFQNLKGEPVKFESPTPKEFAQFINDQNHK